MDTQHVWLLFLATVLLSAKVLGGTYRAAVVEYHPATDGVETVRYYQNLVSYKDFMAKAKKKGVDIIVFPENGLTLKETRIYVPDPAERISPCDSKETKWHQILKDLSCASKNNEIYSVVNLIERRDCEEGDKNCPEKNFYVFNTNVVFDRYGVVIARYSKYNLFDEPYTDKTQDPEISFFDTDFGVRFGTFICFDILFSAPAQKLVQQYHITDFVFTTYWFSELPFLTALQAQRGWAESNNVNLLASGVNQVSSGSSGSGIYNGKYGHLVQTMPETSTSKLLVADVPTIRDTRYSNYCPNTSAFLHRTVNTSFSSPDVTPPLPVASDEKFQLLKDQIDRYTSEVVDVEKTFEKTICSNDFCCDFEITMDAVNKDSKNYTCRAMAFNGVRRFGMKFRGGVQACGVVLCDGPEIQNCTSRLKNISGMFKFKRIKISGAFKARNSFQMPSTLAGGSELKPLSADKYEFNKMRTEKGMEVSLELVWPVIDLHTFAIWGRDFSRDMEPDVPESEGSINVGMPLMIISFINFILFAR